MARRRMFSLDIVDSDQFIDLPISSKLLYYELGVRADDDGFVGNPKKVAKFADCTEEDIKVLEEKGFVYMFDSGILVIRHWTVNNQLRNDRYNPTYYMEEKKKLCKNMDNKMYYLIDESGLPNGIPLVDLDKNRKEENNIEKKKEEEFNSGQLKEEEYKSFGDSDIDPKIKSQFDSLWNKYPKKVGKKEALHYYNEAIKNGESFDIIKHGIEKYLEYLLENDPPDILIKNGFNWFKGNCWNDDYEVNYSNFDYTL